MFSSLVVDYLEQTYGSTAAITYAYFDYKELETQNVIGIAVNVLKQLLARFDDIPDDFIDRLNDMQSRARQSVNIASIIELITNAAQHFTSLYFVVDAFDECESSVVKARFRTFVDHLRMANARIL